MELKRPWYIYIYIYIYIQAKEEEKHRTPEEKMVGPASPSRIKNRHYA